MDDFKDELRCVNRVLVRGLLVTLLVGGAFVLYLVFSLFNAGAWL